MTNELYSSKFYDSQIDGSLASAREIVPLVLGLVPAGSVCDVGCGAGTWLSVFKEAGVETLRGFDGSWVSPDILKIAPEQFIATDLSNPISSPERFDLSMSLEVAEHLPASAADHFIETLTRFAQVVLFSAAIPNQGGTGHINEQWPGYWKEKFAARGYRAIDCIRPAVWANRNIEYWYRQNVLIFASEQALRMYPALKEAAEVVYPMPADVVHPDAFIGDREPDGFVRVVKMLPKLFVRAVKRKIFTPGSVD